MSHPTHVLALDQGTTSSRALLIDAQGRCLAQAQHPLRQSYPQPGWVEHDPDELWATTLAAATEVLARARLPASALAAVGLTNQRETTLLWHRHTSRPVYPAIVWQDRRTAADCQRLRNAGLEPWIRQRTGLRLDPYFSATKISWILHHVPEARRLADRGELCFGTVDSWLIWQLTGGRLHCTDPSNASRTLLYNLHTGTWDPELLNAFSIPASVLPSLVPTSGVFGYTEPVLFGLSVPLAAVAGDQQAALFGQGCLTRGQMKNTYGTGGFALTHTGDRPIIPETPLLATVAWQRKGRTEFALEGSVFVAGAVLQWLRDELQLVRSVEELDALAASVPDANGLFLVPAFTGLGAPHWDPYARGVAIGLTRGVTRAHFCRAALEAIAFQTAELLESMAQETGVPLTELRVDGGASKSRPLLQIQADLLRIPVLRAESAEATALGVALLAGLGAGFWPDDEALHPLRLPPHRFTPTPSSALPQQVRDWRRAVSRAKDWARPESPPPQRGEGLHAGS